MAQVVVDAHREMVQRRRQAGGGRHHCFEMVEHGTGHGGRELLGAEPVAPAHHPRRRSVVVAAPFLRQGRHHIEVEGFPRRARFLAALQHRDRPQAGRQGLHQQRRHQGPEQPHPQHPHPLPTSLQPGGGGLGGLAGRSHQHHQPLRIGGADVVVGAVTATRERRKALHRRHQQIRKGLIGPIHRFTALEIHIRVLGGAAQHRSAGVEGPGPVGLDRLRGNQGLEQGIGEGQHLLDLMGGAEAIEQMEQRQARLQGQGHGDGGEVARLLHRGRHEHRAAGGAAGHHITVVAENREALGRQGPARHLHHHRQPLPRPAEQVGEHQQQPLGGGEGGGEGARLEGAMHRSSRAALALQLHHARHGAP